MDDIVDTYYGNRSETRLEAAIRGPMAAYIDIKDRHKIVAWLKSGAPQKDYGPRIRPILSKTRLNCHTPSSELKVPDLSTCSGLSEVAQVETRESTHTLMKLSHIHPFGVALVLLAVGLIFRLAVLPGWLKYSLIVLPFAAMFTDIVAWFLTKWDPHYAYTVLIGGGLLGLSLGMQTLISLYQVWFSRGAARKPPSKFGRACT